MTAALAAPSPAGSASAAAAAATGAPRCSSAGRLSLGGFCLGQACTTIDRCVRNGSVLVVKLLSSVRPQVHGGADAGRGERRDDECDCPGASHVGGRGETLWHD